MMEIFGVHVHRAATNLSIIVVYRLNSVGVQYVFLNEFIDLIEHVAAFCVSNCYHQQY